MRDEQHRPREALERELQRLTALKVEVVRRLVEDEEVRARRHHDGERQPAALTARERGDRLVLRVLSREGESPQQRLRLPARELRRAGRAVQHQPRSSSSRSCWEKYAMTTPWPVRIAVVGRRDPTIVSSSVVLPEPFGPTSATCSPRSTANEAPRRSSCPARSRGGRAPR